MHTWKQTTTTHHATPHLSPLIPPPPPSTNHYQLECAVFFDGCSGVCSPQAKMAFIFDDWDPLAPALVMKTTKKIEEQEG